jgi:hypothetical protein
MENLMKRSFLPILALSLSFGVMQARAQQGDVALAIGTVSAPASYSGNPATFTQGLGGGTYFGFNGDVLIRHHVGFEAEVNWKTSQGLYAGTVPFRPIFFDFNAIYSRRFNQKVGAEVMAGIGALSTRFYSNAFTSCDIYGNCSNYQSSNHFLGDIGGGVRLYAYHDFFVRPEVRLYLIHNAVEFNSGHAVRYGVSLGYTFGGSH